MERGVSMKPRWIIIGAWLWLMGVGVLHALATEERRLVLVTSEHSRLTPPLLPAEVRKLFLGVAVETQGLRLEPLHNASEALLQEVFLQKIVFMSTQSYERHLISQVFRSGGHRPARYADSDALVKALQHQPGAVTYMWASHAQQIAGIRIVQELWQGPVN